jgi:hypothetical protein
MAIRNEDDCMALEVDGTGCRDRAVQPGRRGRCQQRVGRLDLSHSLLGRDQAIMASTIAELLESGDADDAIRSALEGKPWPPPLPAIS